MFNVSLLLPSALLLGLGLLKLDLTWSFGPIVTPLLVLAFSIACPVAALLIYRRSSNDPGNCS